MKKTQYVSPTPPPKAWLVVHGGPQDGHFFRLRQIVVTVGKDSQLADLVLRDESVSREHIRLRLESGQYTLTDLASLNGSWVNDRQVQACLLSDNDVIRIGNTVLVYKYIPAKLR